jgi:hypothetical protein
MPRCTRDNALQLNNAGQAISPGPRIVFCCDVLRYSSSRGGTRTPDTVINSHLLYHLSYSGMSRKGRRATERGQASGEEET